jgi:hypothetical protein
VVTVDEIRVGDEPGGWRAAGFHVDDDGTCRVGRVRIRLVGPSEGRRIRSWSLRDLAAPPDGAIDGIPTDLSDRAPCEPADHPNGATSIDHVVLVSPDTARTVEALAAVGLEPRRTRHTDTYGTPLRQTFFRAGEVIVELIGPEEPSGDGPAGFFGLAHTVVDLDATAALLGEHLGRVKEAVQPGRRIATLRHRELGMSVATALMSPDRDAPR